MKQDHIARTSQRMASITMLLLVGMLALNIGSWLFPETLACVADFSNPSLKLGIDPASLPWWQLLGGVVLTNIPLLALGYGLFQLRALFQRYAQGEYFSPAAAIHLGRVGRGIAWWVLLNFLCGSLSSVWLTITRPVGHRLLNISFDGNAIVALFMAACITVIARILQRASEVDAENRQFV
ncbi:Protein of unknown function [Collimonas sp. OK242]|jgi:hypothetical protein|uniref:DUF2975 domain-containing protein n=1 Tax=Collimonas sp. OK242 TaxID=1798195 RepID=UPI00089CAF5B|nr:DUF2975 domain-containing protein [Collimonas sp. OK242]SDX72256.1 Protein of unknown function [Collimonas sp. OK242]